MIYKKEQLKWTEHNELMLADRFVMLEVKLFFNNIIGFTNGEAYFYGMFDYYNNKYFNDDNKQDILNSVWDKLCKFSELFEDE